MNDCFPLTTYTITNYESVVILLISIGVMSLMSLSVGIWIFFVDKFDGTLSLAIGKHNCSNPYFYEKNSKLWTGHTYHNNHKFKWTAWLCGQIQCIKRFFLD